LLIGGCSTFWGPSYGGLFATFIMIGVGALLLAGLWTPITGTLLAIIEVWVVFFQGGQAEIHLPLATLGVSLVMLGPGAWSVDARLFGRKQINIRSR
jgi:putative oxidoreductase